MRPVLEEHAPVVDQPLERALGEDAEAAPEREQVGPRDDVDRVELDPAGRLGEAREVGGGKSPVARPIELLAREEEVGDGAQGNARRGRHGRRCMAESLAEG